MAPSSPVALVAALLLLAVAPWPPGCEASQVPVKRYPKAKFVVSSWQPSTLCFPGAHSPASQLAPSSLFAERTAAR